MKIFAAGIQTETNTFAPWPTGMRAFSEGRTARGNAVFEGHAPEHATARLWRDCCQRDGHDVFASLFASAEPSGPTIQSVYEGLREEILRDLRSNDTWD